MDLLSIILGGIFRLLPSGIDLLHKKQENAQELALLDKQIALADKQGANKLAEINAQSTASASSDEARAMLEALKGQSAPTGIAWVDAVNSTVRPFLTYYHCVLIYSLYKAALFVIALKGGITWDKAVVELYTEFDRSLVGSMMSFWFVDRALRKLGR